MTCIKASNVSLQVYFIKKFEMTPTAANAITGLIYTISAIASPFLGMVTLRKDILLRKR